MSQSAGRNTKAAQSRKRQTWAAGAGGVTTVEKDGFGLWIDDIVYAFTEISVTSLPILYIVLTTAGIEFFGAKSAAMIAWMTMVVVAGAGVLMVSNVLYRSFKDLDLRGRVPFAAILLVVLVFVVVALDPATVLFVGFLIYALSGPVRALFRRKPRRAQ